MIPSRREALGRIDRLPEKTEPEEVVAKIVTEIKLWMMNQGKVQEVLINGEIFVVHDDYPEHLDPVQVAENFIKVFDTQKTRLIRKVKNPPITEAFVPTPRRKPGVAPGVRTGKAKIHETEKPVGKFNSVAIHKTRIIQMYRRFTGSFTSNDITEFLLEIYPEINRNTAKNKQYAYIHYMRDQGFIEATDRDLVKNPVTANDWRTNAYKFVVAPYGAEPAAQADYDPDYTKLQALAELNAMRRSD